LSTRLLVAGAAITMVAAGCGNASSNSSSKTPKTAAPGQTLPPVQEASGAQLQQNDPVSAPGVTSSTINVVTITAATNLLGGHYAEYADGVQDYFNYVNAPTSQGGLGGIYGRQLKIKANRDDKMLNNQQTVIQSLSQDHAFATFIATPVFNGAPYLAASNPRMPTFIWNINAEFATTPKQNHDNFFGTIGAICNACIGQASPYLAYATHASKVGILAYGVNAASKDCATGIKKSFTAYPTSGATVAYFNDNLAFAQPDLSAQVAQMKSDGVQLIFTCIDLNESLILGKELKRQGLNAPQQLPNAYDEQFVAQNGQYLEGDYLDPQFVPKEKNANIPEEQLFQTWAAKSGKQVRELTYEGWIAANQFVTGLKIAGPDFSQEKVIDGLNQLTDFSANGMIVPINWTIQHNDPTGPGGLSIPKYSSKWDCATVLQVHDSKFVPVFDQPNKPWICMVGGPNAKTLTTTPEYENFASSGG
jgi:ABC-type branched-subunit amino acid transport system substrate-binding protein